ncbi:telomerase protein component 1-like [Babylonia areolata]|uniref:telomerase protein component 1-like n=1 Tax=Babylonia areolata TaxID=304850 RepID=UPI003FCF9042
MYRRFKSGNRAETKDSQQSDTQAEEDPQCETDPEIVQQVARVWKAVADICRQSVDNGQPVHKAENATAKLGGWQTVRIFVSSTFTDFFSEREVLVKKVFPELQEWCRERKVRLVECDLRWGVPKDATSTQALLTCLEEIDRCYDANQQPFFLNMLGERYGWIPGKEEVPEEVRDRYDWVENSSMTFMELLYGALRISNPNAAFFLRDPCFIPQLPEPHTGRFQGESALAREHMKVLKDYLKKHYPQQVFPYTAQFGGLTHTTGRELVSLTGLEGFADQVKEFFQAAIDRAYPAEDSTADLTPEEKERELQGLFVKEKAETLMGRATELQQLMNYARGLTDHSLAKIDGKESTMRKAEDWDVEEGDSLLCMVTAQGGWGKTALLAGLVSQAKQEGMDVMYHFVGSTATSGSHTAVLHRLLVALDPDGAGRESEADADTMKKHLRRCLASCRESQRQMLIVIDGVNELDNSGSPYHLSWLPTALPPGVRCVVSANVSHLPTTSRLTEHPAFHLSLSALDSPALCALAASFFQQYGKKLEPEQLQQMVQITKVDNPLWMTLMCEELRVFGDFRMMDSKLRALPDTMDAFLATVIGRLLTEDDTGYVKKALYLMASSTTGLPTDHILQVLGDAESKTECPPLYWAQARRVLKPYSRTVQSAGDVTEYFTFVHEAMWKAVRQCMEAAEEDRRVWHKQLADFFQFSCDSLILRINYLPLQLRLAGLNSRLIDFIRRDPHAARMPGFQRSRLLSELRCRNPSDTLSGTREIIMCQMCTHRSGGFNPGVLFPNKDVCCLCCSLVVQPPASRRHARLCMQHAMKNRMGPSVYRCCVCQGVVMADRIDATKPFGPKPAVLCHLCGLGINGKMCAMFRDHLS